MAGYVLILSVLLLGGVIATVGDRLGYRVGKARLSLFNLRPRNTAVLITILTGSLISASTLGILFSVSDSLRTGVFELEKLQKKLSDTRTALEDAQATKSTLETELEQARRARVAAQTQLEQARRQRLTAQDELDRINQSLEEAQTAERMTADALVQVEDRADRLRLEVDRIEREKQTLITQRNVVNAQIAARDQEVQRQETVIAEGQAQVDQLEATQNFLNEAIGQLEEDLTLLRERRVVITRNEVLAGQLVQVNDRTEAERVLEALLRQADQAARSKTQPGVDNSNEPIVQIPQVDVERVVSTLGTGQPYVVRILSAGNYITGETQVLVFMDVALNQVLFTPNQVIASTVMNADTMTPTALRERLNLLLSAAQFRAKQSGMVSESVEVQVDSLVRFLDQVIRYDRPLVVQAITPVATYTTGPLRLEFLALDNDQILFRSGSPSDTSGL